MQQAYITQIKKTKRFLADQNGNIASQIQATQVETTKWKPR